mmetsp:Transcript_34777/g.56321  ORF Transcript_34777/g.56321 Transcript_34777/m.56321 type:complete len:89 (+) Transcript_34777:670-936(+)
MSLTPDPITSAFATPSHLLLAIRLDYFLESILLICLKNPVSVSIGSVACVCVWWVGVALSRCVIVFINVEIYVCQTSGRFLPNKGSSI